MKNRYMRISFSFILILVALSTKAQIVEIVDESTGLPVENVAVFNTDQSKSTLSDKQGKFDMEIFSKPDTLFFQHPSYRLKRMTLDEIAKKGNKIQLIESVINLPEIILSATRDKEEKRDIAYKVDVVTQEEIAQTNPQTSADVLEQTGNVLVQKSQMGGGSPIIRGFEANKVLLVVDGVRMNNAIYRSGHLQNAITVDNSILERTEVVFGPASVIYGSDALGGVIHYYTKDPVLSEIDTISHIDINGFTRYSSANSENTTHVDMNYGLKKWGFLSAVTLSDFGDLKMGENRAHGYDNWGLRKFYAARVDGRDTMLPNPDPNVQIPTGYRQTDLMQKVYFEPSVKNDYTLNLQYSTTSEIPRFDQLNDFKDDHLEFADWKYGPQTRFLGSLRHRHKTSSQAYDQVTTILAFQKVKESRIQRRFGANERFHRDEDLNIYSVNMDLSKDITDRHRFHYGLEATYNSVESSGLSVNIVTGGIQQIQPRYPDGGSIMATYSAYATDKFTINPKWILTGGARFTGIQLRSVFTDEGSVDLPFDEVNIDAEAFTGSLSLIWRPDPTWQFNLIGSTGFRAPNVDDYGKIRENDGNITVPNNELAPEYAYNSEIGVNKTVWEKLSLQGVAFYTLLDDAIVRREWTVNGQDSIMFNGALLNVQTNINADQAVIYGGCANLKFTFNDRLLIESSINITEGRDISNDRPLAHIPPTFGRTSIRYKYKKFTGVFWSKYNGWKLRKDYALTGEDNIEEAVPKGTPSWYTLNIGGTYQLRSYLRLQASVENILDYHYKVFSSGISAPGRNFIVALRIGF